MRLKSTITHILLTLALLFSTVMYADEVKKDAKAVTTEHPALTTESLNLMLRHMTADELFAEADGWMLLLRDATKTFYATELSVKEKKAEIDALKRIEDNNETSDEEKAFVKNKVTQLNEEKDSLLDELSKKHSKRDAMVSRLNKVLENINEKIGLDENGNELERVLPYRRYINTVQDITLEVNDAETGWKIISEWFTSQDGGIYWFNHILKFLGILIFAIILSKLLRKGVQQALKISPSHSKLLNDFIANSVHTVVIFVGLLIAISALGINVGPLMALVGAAGFVVAFALQGTLSNFASGLMIMFYRPFDIGDIVEVADITGTVNSMTLVSTTIITFDNRMMIVPNNTIWGNIITNVTHRGTRRVDMTFGIGYNEDIEHAEEVMKKILAENPLILKDPKPVVTVRELADSSVNFICRPWAKTEDYWTVYSDVTRAVKKEFDKEGISIPFPQMDVHIDKNKTL